MYLAHCGFLVWSLGRAIIASWELEVLYWWTQTVMRCFPYPPTGRTEWPSNSAVQNNNIRHPPLDNKFLFYRMGSCYVPQAGLELWESSEPLASSVPHCSWLIIIFLNVIFLFILWEFHACILIFCAKYIDILIIVSTHTFPQYLLNYPPCPILPILCLIFKK